MARKRFITSDISVDERIARVAVENPTGALMWPWLLLNLDDWGRGTANPLRIKLGVFPAFPFTTEEISKAVDSFVQVGLVHKYEVDEEEYIAVKPKSWIKYQTYLNGTKRNTNGSRLPEPVNPPWDNNENEAMRQKMTRMSADKQECQLTTADVSRQTGMAVPSPSPSPSPSQEIEESIYVGHSVKLRVPYARIVEVWNTVMLPKGLPEVREITDSRKAWMKREWAKQREKLKTVEDFEAFFQYLATKCTFMFSGTWFSFDWLFKYQNNFTKALEGNYEDGRRKK